MSYAIPAQSLLTLNEMGEYLAKRQLPGDFVDRLEVLLDERTLAESPQAIYRSDAQVPLEQLLAWDEVELAIEEGLLPGDFADRVNVATDDVCKNCSDRQCMDCLCRFVHEQCRPDCPDCC
jgi:hypothetical protein